MPENSDILSALNAMAEDNFAMGAAWQAAHELAQAHEGVPNYDALHAFCHRIEGDSGNAAYWDRRADTDFGHTDPAVEFAQLRAHLTE